MGGRREVSIITHRPLTRNDLKQERSFFPGSVSTFLQLVVANINIIFIKSLRIAVLMIIKKYRTSVILCIFAVRYIFGQFLQKI